MITIPFCNTHGQLCRINILVDIPTIEYALSGGNDPILECHDVDIYTPIHPSSLTFTILIDNWLDITRILNSSTRVQFEVESRLMWQGVLDLSQTEYPFFPDVDITSLQPLTLTAVDFARLSDLSFARWGSPNVRTATLLEVINVCLYDYAGATDINIAMASIPSPYILTNQSNQSPTLPQFLEMIKVDLDNFFDEQGVPLSRYQVLEECLRPFCLHIRQAIGAAPYIYTSIELRSDHLDEIFEAAAPSTHTLDVPVEYSEVTHSPFGSKDIFSAELDPERTPVSGQIYSYKLNRDTSIAAFDMQLSPTFIPSTIDYIPQFTANDRTTILATITPHANGSNETIILANAKHPTNNTDIIGSFQQTVPYLTLNSPFQPLFTIDCGVIHNSNVMYADRIHIVLPLLCDARYNPYEESSKNDEINYGTNQYKFENQANFAYIPVRVAIYAPDNPSYCLCYLRNTHVVALEGQQVYDPVQWIKSTTGDDGSNVIDCWLSYYDDNNRKQKTGLGLWTENKYTIGCHYDKLSRYFTVQGKGLVVPPPPFSGIMRVTIGRGIYYHDYNFKQNDIHPLMRWFAYRLPIITTTTFYNTTPDYSDHVLSLGISSNTTTRATHDESIILNTLSPEETESSAAIPLNAHGYLFDKNGHLLQPYSIASKVDKNLIFSSCLHLVQHNIEVNSLEPAPTFMRIIHYQKLPERILPSAITHLLDGPEGIFYFIRGSITNLITTTTDYTAREIIAYEI